MADHRRSRSPSFHGKHDPHIMGEDLEDDFIWPPEKPHQEGGEGPGRIGADGRRLIEPDWLGVALAGVHPAGYDMDGSSGRLLIQERNPNHGLDLDSICAHTTAFVRSVIPYLYREIPGFLEAYGAELAEWTCSARVMTVWKTNRHEEDYVVHLTLPAEITPNSKKYPAPDVLPVDLARSSLTTASVNLLQNRRQGGTFGPVTVRHYLYTTFNWTLATPYIDPRNRDAGDHGALRARNDPPPESTSWIATLSGRPGRGSVKVLVTFDERLTKVHEKLRDEGAARRREGEQQVRALGKGRREYKPLARALF